MTLKSWREIVKPHSDVINGQAKMADFAADLTKVVQGTAPAQYQNPALFFQYTYITQGTSELLLGVARRISGKGGDPIIQLQTGFGGGKTHSMLAVYHMAKADVPSYLLFGLKDILKEHGFGTLPKCKVAVLDGNAVGPSELKLVKQNDGTVIETKTLWGYLAATLAGTKGYELVRASDENGTSPGKDVLVSLLSMSAPCVILIDELVAYVRQLTEGHTFLGGTFQSNLSFIQALTEAVNSVDTAVLLASLPESDTEVGGEYGKKTLNALAEHFGRMHAIWRSVDKEESFEIVRRRLFESIEDDDAAKQARDAVCDAYFDLYRKNGHQFPSETQLVAYRQKLIRSYPIHPEIFDQLYSQWTTLDRFQRTRGVLKMMSNAIHALWIGNNQDLMILPGSLPLGDIQTQSHFTNPLENSGWPNIITTDIDGDQSTATRIDADMARYGSVQAARRVARTIFLATAPGRSADIRRGIDEKRILLGVVNPFQQLSTYTDVLNEIARKCHYLHVNEGHFLFGVTPNLTTEMQSRLSRYRSRKQVAEVITPILNQSLKGAFQYVHIFASSGDIPDDQHLRLAVLPLNQSWSKSSDCTAKIAATEILKSHGSGLRINRNRIIFLACDALAVDQIESDTAVMLAWNSIAQDASDGKLNLDINSLEQARNRARESQKKLTSLIDTSFKRLMAPYARTGIVDLEWDDITASSGTSPLGDRVFDSLVEEEAIITKWAPIHLKHELDKLFWANSADCLARNVWELFCKELYCPRLLDSEVLRATIQDGSGSEEFFGLAQSKDTNDRYEGFSFGSTVSVYLDASLTLIAPEQAKIYQERSKPQIQKQSLLSKILDAAQCQWSDSEECSLAVLRRDIDNESFTDEEFVQTLSQGALAGHFIVAIGKTNCGYGEQFFKRTFPGPYQDGIYLIRPSAEPIVVPRPPVVSTDPKVNKIFNCTVDIPKDGAKQFAQMALSAFDLLLKNPDIEMSIQIDISVKSPSGFSEAEERSVKENLASIGCDNGEFLPQ